MIFLFPDNKSINLQDLIDQRLTSHNKTNEIGHQNASFIRKGKVEGWKEEITEEYSSIIDEWTKIQVTNKEHLKLFD